MENQKPTILIVDDDHEFVQSVEDVLMTEDYNVLKAYDGDSGLKLALKERPDLMLLDVMMTHNNTEGIEVSRKISETPELKGMPIIMVTGIMSKMNLPFKFEPDETWLPVNTLLEKPVAPQKLLTEIKECLK